MLLSDGGLVRIIDFACAVWNLSKPRFSFYLLPITTAYAICQANSVPPKCDCTAKDLGQCEEAVTSISYSCCARPYS